MKKQTTSSMLDQALVMLDQSFIENQGTSKVLDQSLKKIDSIEKELK